MRTRVFQWINDTLLVLGSCLVLYAGFVGYQTFIVGHTAVMLGSLDPVKAAKSIKLAKEVD